MEEMARQHEVFFYGPGFPFYDPEDKIEDVISKSPFLKPDLICVGHSWLGDNKDHGIHVHQQLNLTNTTIPKVMFLNKEYVLLNEKLKFVNDNDICCVFSHLHNICEFVHNNKKAEFIFWPFAANDKVFHRRNLEKKYDLCFTGVLRNRIHSQTQVDFRIQVQRKLFYTIGELKLCKRRRVRKLDIYWDGIPANDVARKINDLLRKPKRLSITDYSLLLNQSKICLCSLSPMGLISPRYFEAMASACLVLCPDTIEHRYHFQDGFNCIMVKPDLSNFYDRFEFAINSEAVSGIIQNAYTDVMKNHTWRVRIEQFTQSVVKNIYN